MLRRAEAFFLLHAGIGLTPAQVGAAVGRTDRALRTVQSLSAPAFLESVWTELGRHRQRRRGEFLLLPAALALSGVAARTLAKVLGGTELRRPTYGNAWKRLPRTSLFILHDDTPPPLDVLHELRTRQHHEQGYHIGVHDLWLDSVPSGYPKDRRPDRPGFRPDPLTLCAWIAAVRLAPPWFLDRLRHGARPAAGRSAPTNR